MEAGNKDLTSPFDPSKEKETEEFRFRAPNVVNSYMEKHFRRTLSKEERTAMLRVHPKPDTPVASPPKLDQFMSDFAGKRLEKAHDTQLIKIQTNLLYAANPLAKLWSEVVEQGLDQDPKALIPIADVLDTIQKALVLLGSANNTISETRREMALGAAHSSFRKYAKGDFSETGADLFGEAFKEVLVQKVETDSALSKAVSIANKSAGPKVFQRPQRSRMSESSWFFSGGRVSRYGDWPGKTCSPYRNSWKGQHIQGRTFARKASVFSRLGPSQTERHKPTDQQQN